MSPTIAEIRRHLRFGHTIAEQNASVRPESVARMFRREGDHWRIARRGRTSAFRGTLGFEYLVSLLARPGREIAALELEAVVSPRGRGRRRKFPSRNERARLNVTRAIRSAMARIARADPVLGEHLDRAIHTGTFCSYEPDPGAPPRWFFEAGDEEP